MYSTWQFQLSQLFILARRRIHIKFSSLLPSVALYFPLSLSHTHTLVHSLFIFGIFGCRNASHNQPEELRAILHYSSCVFRTYIANAMKCHAQHTFKAHIQPLENDIQ